ncbi:MAG: SCO family protein, partial [Candidatus Competibacteraceae bacterium]|nr:SCO family protein [Candidatus Competibacteraceae bacterium]
MAKPTRRRAVPRAVWWSLAAVVIMGLGAAFQLWQSSSQVMQPLEVSGVYLNKPQPVVDFTLVNDEGGAFTKAELQGKWTFIYFGYTSCPDVCPTT